MARRPSPAHPAYPAHTHLFVPVFLSPVLRPRPRPFPRITPRRPRHSTSIRASAAEEELFIRRHATPPATHTPSLDTQKNQVPKVTNISPPPAPPPQDPDDAEEHFDFVREPNGPGLATTEQDALPHPKQSDITSNQDTKDTKAERTSSTATAPREATSNSSLNPIAVRSPMRGFGRRLGKETSRLFTESQLVSRVRMPSRRETVLFAWEFAMVVALLLLLRAGVASTLKWIHNRLNATRGLKSNIPYEASVFECMQRPLEFLSLFTVGTALAEAVSRPLAAIGLLKHIRVLRELGIIISAAWFLLRWIDRIRSRFSVAKGVDKAQVDATSRIATVATFVGSLLISLDTIGVNVQTVLAFGGIGGVAIGFAGREIISNFFGGFMIYVTRPFSVGEWVRSIEEKELNGTVEDIGWYLTRVRTWDKRPLYIPNSRFSTLIVENGSRMDNRRILHTLHMRHEDMPVVPTVVAAIQSLLMNHPELDPRQHRLAYVDSFGEYSVRIWISCYTKSVFLYDFRRVQQDILVKCYEIIRANGAKLATINTRDVRPGSDTDRYGPLGNKAVFPDISKAAQNIHTPQPESNRVPVNNDVPQAQQYGETNPVVRFHNIESGVEFSQMDLNTPNGVTAGLSWNTTVPPASAPNESKADQRVIGDYPVENIPPRSMSEAAVAAAAAALAAARRNAARIEDDEKTPTKQPPGTAEQADTAGATFELTPTTTPPAAQMKITGARPPRATQVQSVADIPNPQSGEPVRRNEGKEEAVVNMPQAAPSANDELPKPPVQVASNQSNTANAGEMKITKARKPAQIVSPADGVVESPDSTDKVRSSGMRDNGDGSKISIAPNEGRSTGNANIKNKKPVVQPAKAGGAMPSTVSRVKNSADGTVTQGSVKNEGRVEATGKLSSAHGNTNITTSGQPLQTQQNLSGASGEMKISKGRKPVIPLSPGATEVEGKVGLSGNGQSPSTSPSMKSQEAVTSQKSNLAEDQTEDD